MSERGSGQMWQKFPNRSVIEPKNNTTNVTALKDEHGV